MAQTIAQIIGFEPEMSFKALIDLWAATPTVIKNQIPVDIRNSLDGLALSNTAVNTAQTLYAQAAAALKTAQDIAAAITNPATIGLKAVEAAMKTGADTAISTVQSTYTSISNVITTTTATITGA